MATGCYLGTLVDENEEYIIVDMTHYTRSNAFGKGTELTGHTFINKKYIMSISFK